MDAKQKLGLLIRQLREERGISQEELASVGGITYQYLSAVENGRENFTIGVLESLCRALNRDLPAFVTQAYCAGAGAIDPVVDPRFFRQRVPLPPMLEPSHLEMTLNKTQKLISDINRNLLALGGKPLHAYIQGNNFSGLVSNMLCSAFDELTPYKHKSHQSYPDLLYKDPKNKKDHGLEVKTTIQVGKGGESHNGHSGWHLIGCFELNKETGNVLFLHIMLVVLNGHTLPDSDWVYVGSKVNKDTGSRRTETYNTNIRGTTKLRDGSVYLNTDKVDFSRWRQERSGALPPFSIFNKKS